MKIKLRAKNLMIPVEMTQDNDYIYFRFRYNRVLKDEIKSMAGARWVPDKKLWKVSNTARNWFQIAYLAGRHPYDHYDRSYSYEHLKFERPLFRHQKELTAFGLDKKHCIFACEMGTGKTLAAIEIMERSGLNGDQCMYVGPRSGIIAVERELRKWDSKVLPIMMTYEKLVRFCKEVSTSILPLEQKKNQIPKLVIFDESSKIKTPTAKRSQAAMWLVDTMRECWEETGTNPVDQLMGASNTNVAGCHLVTPKNTYVILMSGTPAPKTPLDWYHQCEVACPGYLKEGNIHKFRERLSLVERRESPAGGIYPHVVTWLDDESKCGICGKYRDEHYMEAEVSKDSSTDHLINQKDENNKPILPQTEILVSDHHWIGSRNEVDALYRRMKGLVTVKFKKDCLDLPEKTYQVIKVRPTVEMLRAAQMIKSKSTRAIEALTLLRELSDGFQYKDVVDGTKMCDRCKGIGKANFPKNEIVEHNESVEYETRTCDVCEGSGEVKKYKREAIFMGSAKDEEFFNILEDHEEVGRLVVWGGFTGTIDRLVAEVHKKGWHTLRVDGRGFVGQMCTGDDIDKDIFLQAFDANDRSFKSLLDTYPKIVFIGHPKAGGMALTLTGSPTEVFYSNVFDGEARFQAEDRIHRPGCKGANIIDLLCLETDYLVLENLKKKRQLQDISMGELENAF